MNPRLFDKKKGNLPMHMIQWRNHLLLLIIGLYLILNNGFMQLRVPPAAGTGVPIGEIVLILSLLTLHYGKVLGKLSATVVLWPFLIWWLFGLGHALLDARAYGFWALRDATHMIESLFLIVGFAFATRLSALQQFFRWLPLLLIIGVIYALTYPISRFLSPFSPTVLAGAGYKMSLLFNYLNAPIILITAAIGLLLFSRSYVEQQRNLLIAVLLLGFTIFLFQARTIYLQLIALIGLFAIYRRDVFGKSLIGILFLVIFLMALPLLDLQIKGRLGQTLSFEFLLNHFLAIGGIATPGLEGSAKGVSQRLDWWKSIYEQLTAGFIPLLTGLGYGIPLTDFYVGPGRIVREPHNSYISIVGRLGLIGLFAWLWMHAMLLIVWQRCYKLCQHLGWRDGENYLLVLMSFFVLIWVFSLGEDGLEKPFNAIPYYFFWGIVLGLYYQLHTNLYKRTWELSTDTEQTSQMTQLLDKVIKADFPVKVEICKE